MKFLQKSFIEWLHGVKYDRKKYHLPNKEIWVSYYHFFTLNRKYKDYVYRKMLVQEYLKK